MWKVIIIAIILAYTTVNGAVEGFLKKDDPQTIDFYDSFYLTGYDTTRVGLPDVIMRSDVHNNIWSYTEEFYDNDTQSFVIEHEAFDFNDMTRYSYYNDTGICEKDQVQLKYETLLDLIKAIELNGYKESEVEKDGHIWKRYSSYFDHFTFKYDTEDDVPSRAEINMNDIDIYFIVNISKDFTQANFTRSDHIPDACN